MSEIEDVRLKARVDARKRAATIVELALNESPAGDAHDVFWQEIRDAALKMLPLQPIEPKLVKARPMSDAEAREFEKEQIPFGRYDGWLIGQCGPVEIQYLSWLADQTFIDNLRRYLANETIARQR